MRTFGSWQGKGWGQAKLSYKLWFCGSERGIRSSGGLRNANPPYDLIGDVDQGPARLVNGHIEGRLTGLAIPALGSM